MKKFILVSAFLLFFNFNLSFAQSDFEFTIEELANASKPAIVRVVATVNGSIEVPNFMFDFANFEIVEPKEGDSISIEFDKDSNTFEGTGFIISEDGIIVTNSHLINGLLNQKYIDLTKIYLETTTDEQALAIEKRFGSLDKAYVAVYEKIYQYIKEKSKKNFTLDVKILKPDDVSKDYWTLVENGYKAEILYSNENFSEDHKDIAIIKINETKLPTISINSFGNIAVGQKVFAFGFPSSAFLAEGDYLEPTFSQGNLNAIKNDKGIDIYQTDAGVSEGSSGSPVFNSEGKVIGIVTYLSGSETSGTQFGFAIPINLVNDILKEKNILIKENQFFDQYKTGINLMNEKHCKKAINAFEQLSEINSSFGVQKYINPKIESCRKMIESGESVDSYFSQIMLWLKNNIGRTIFGLVMLILFGVASFLVFLRMKKDELKIEEMSDEIEKMEEHEKVCDNEHLTQKTKPDETIVINTTNNSENIIKESNVEPPIGPFPLK